MTELHLIPCCYLNGKYCSYNSAFIDGYFLGFVTMLFIMSLVGIINDVNEKYKYIEDEDKDEPENNSPDPNENEENEEVDEEEEQPEKSDEDKKDE